MKRGREERREGEREGRRKEGRKEGRKREVIIDSASKVAPSADVGISLFLPVSKA